MFDWQTNSQRSAR